MEWVLAWVLGIGGSLHCIGMCGPIMWVVPWQGKSGSFINYRMLTYHLGRIGIYISLGLLAGSVGQGLELFGIQQYLSIVCGVLMLLAVLVPRFFPSLINRIPQGIRSLFQRQIQSSHPSRYVILGAVNGLLPCGLVYMAVASSIVTGSGLHAGLYMLMFGLGTLPAMIIVSVLGKKITPAWAGRVRKAIPVLVVTVALLFIVRGMNLGIPYLSPEIKPQTQEVKCCQ